MEGVRTGNWLTKSEAERPINRPDTGTLKGCRDRAILAVMIGCGLRRGRRTRVSGLETAVEDQVPEGFQRYLGDMQYT